MKKTILTIVFLLISFSIYSDELRIPFSCYPKEMQREFAEYGYGFKLDLDANERTEESWGFLVSRGSDFTIYTYKTVRTTGFTMIMDIVHGRKFNKEGWIENYSEEKIAKIEKDREIKFQRWQKEWEE